MLGTIRKLFDIHLMQLQLKAIRLGNEQLI